MSKILDIHNKLNKQKQKTFDCRLSLFLSQIDSKYSDDNFRADKSTKELQAMMIADIDGYIHNLIATKSCSASFAQDLQLWLRQALQIGE